VLIAEKLFAARMMALLYARTLVLAKGIIQLYLGLGLQKCPPAGEDRCGESVRGDKDLNTYRRAAAMSCAGRGLSGLKKDLPYAGGRLALYARRKIGNNNVRPGMQ
jgi:hypothetical protein